MKFCVTFATLIAVVLSGPVEQTAPEDDIGLHMKYFLVETSPGVFEVEDLVNVEIDTKALPTDVHYRFFSTSDPDQGIDVSLKNIAALRNTAFSASKETLFIIHGWKGDKDINLNYHIKEAVLGKYDANVFVVDWSPVAAKNYASAKLSVTPVGRYVASFIQSLSAIYGVKLGNVALVGHSLGAHVAGSAGAALRGQLDHIVGLDPALPLFSIDKTEDRLDPTDAKFVQVIHTNGGRLGFAAPIGHADYYPNGGRSQPGCGLDVVGGCAHSRSYVYYAEAISSRNNLFSSVKCTSYDDYSKGLCASNEKSVMGGYKIDTSANQNYYLDTNAQTPYAKG